MSQPEMPEWEMSGETKEDIQRAIADGTYGHLPQSHDAAGVQALQDRVGRQALTAQLAGTQDKKSREWKNARDQLSRWRSGRRSVSSGAKGRLTGAAQGVHRARIAARGTLHVSLTATIITSKKPWSGVMSADLTGPMLTQYLGALEQGDYTTAAMIVADGYGLDPDIVGGVEGIHGFHTDAEDLRPESE